jgi:flagellin
MTYFINTNIDALSLQRRLVSNQTELARMLNRLSSGLRVSQASDDAAGLAVAARMESQIRGMNQGVRNTNDVISTVMTAESQLNQMTELLQRARELSLQAANGSYVGSDRIAMNGELKQVLSEYDRIAASKSINGQTLLDGTVGTAQYQLGANATDRVSFDWNFNMRASAQGSLQMLSSADLRNNNGGSGGGFSFAGTYTTPAISNLNFSIVASPFRGGALTTAGALNLNFAGAAPTTFTVDGTTVSLNTDFGTSVATLATAVQGQLNAAHGGWYSVTASGGAITIAKTASAASPTSAVSVAAGSGAADISAFVSGAQSAGAAAVTATFAGFSVDGHRVYIDSNYSGNDGGLIADIQAQLDAAPGLSGVYQVSGSAAGVSIAKVGSLSPPGVGNFVGTGATTFAQAPSGVLTLGAGDLQLQFGSGPKVDIVGSFTSADALAGAIMSQAKGIYATVDTTTGKMKLLSTQSFTVSGTQADPGGSIAFDAADSQTNGNLGTVNLFNVTSAVEVVMRIDATLESVNQARATLGAYQNRLLYALSNLQTGSDNLTQARGRIVDADYAQELANLTKQQILQQAAQAMLVQANHLASNVLALLR